VPPSPLGRAGTRSTGIAPVELYGRERELGLLAGLVDDASESGGALIVRGEAGIGKSALLAAVRARASDQKSQVLSATGIQSEARLPFAGLHQFIKPVLDLAGMLPARQRAALLAAFGMSGDARPEPFLIGLATLELIGEASESSPLLLVIDDAQWLDEPTCTVLAFAARRLAAERAVMLIAVRDGMPSPFDEAGLPELRVAGLDERAAAELLDSRSPRLEPELRHRVLAEAVGNPLALVELPDALRQAQLQPDSPLAPSHLPLTTRLERAFAARLRGLPAVTSSVLLAAAADDTGVIDEVLRAASAVTGEIADLGALAPATTARLVEVSGSRLRFRHPLVRSAVYQTATAADRRAVHAALASVLAEQPDRQVWHAAAAAVGTDEQVATQLEAAATRAYRRGATTAAIDAMTKAVQLSSDRITRGARLMSAVSMAYHSGNSGIVPRLLDMAEQFDLPSEQYTWLSWLREAYGSDWSGVAKLEHMVAVANQMREAGHADLAWDPLLSIALRCYWGNPSQSERSAVAAAAERLGAPDEDPALLCLRGWTDPVRFGALVNDQIKRLTPDPSDPAGCFYAGSGATAVWAWDRSLAFFDAAVASLRELGKVALLGRVLASQAWAAVHLTRAPLALSTGAEGARLSREKNDLRWAITADLARAAVLLESGDQDAGEELVRAAEAALLPMGANPMLALAQFARGRGAVVNQRYEEGFEHLSRILDPADHAYHRYAGTWGQADLIEAAAQTGRTEAAAGYLRQLESLAAATAGPLLRAGAAYARPFLASDDLAESLYQSAIRDELGNWPGYRSRMLLWYGVWLRRQRRAVESRAPLRAARDSLDALGYTALAERARQELRASGESSVRKQTEIWDQLTPQELQIARMAAQGMTNREIGQQLYLSHRTVGAHLYRIFPKLGITTRAQLHAVMPE
jgi:DNA-binding CsgD family transcriptional regulator